MKWIDGAATPESVSDQISGVILQPRHQRLWWKLLALSACGVGVLVVSIGVLLYQGIGVWGVTRPVGWGLAIVNFVWWIGIGHAGTLISAVLLLLRQSWRASINRFAEAMTLFAVAMAGLYPIIHLGRPWFFYWLLPLPNTHMHWPQWRSPLVWDFAAIATYATVSLLFWYMGLLPDLAADLGVTIPAAGLLITGYALGVVVGGPIIAVATAKLPRKTTLIGLAVLFVVGNLLCALAPDYLFLMVARVVTAFGHGAFFGIGAIVAAGLVPSGKRAQAMAMLFAGLTLANILGVPAGTALGHAFGWRSTFLAALAFGLVLAVVIATMMPETLRARSPQPLSPVAIFRGFGTLLHNRAFRVYVALTALAYAGLFAFISGSSFVLIGIYGLTPVAFGFSFGFAVLGYITGTIIAQRLVGRRGMDGVIAIGVACLAGGGLAMLVGVLTGVGGAAGVVAPMALYACGVGLTMPQAQASAMMPFPDRAGAASSFNGLCQMLLAACVGLLVGHLLKDSALPLPLVLAVLGVASLVLCRATRAIRSGKS